MKKCIVTRAIDHYKRIKRISQVRHSSAYCDHSGMCDHEVLEKEDMGNLAVISASKVSSYHL